jgi:hypothetical protein
MRLLVRGGRRSTISRPHNAQRARRNEYCACAVQRRQCGNEIFAGNNLINGSGMPHVYGNVQTCVLAAANTRPLEIRNGFGIVAAPFQKLPCQFAVIPRSTVNSFRRMI